MKPFASNRFLVRMLACVALLLGPALSAAQLLPGVYGYGLDRTTNPAGFGSTATIIHVTTVEDNGNDTTPTPGSLRAAIKPSGPRIVVFDVSGIIDLKARLTIRTANLTIAGQTAPSPGIALHGQPLLITASNVLIQHLRVRPGDRWLPNTNTSNRDAIEVESSGTIPVRNVVIDHCTFGWSLDEIASTWNAWEDVTFNKCIFAEPLFRSIHLDEDTLTSNVPKQIESLTVTPTNFGAATTASHADAVNGTYREWTATIDGAILDFALPIIAATNQTNEEHIVVGGITGPDRARFKVEVRLPNDTLLQTSEVFDQYATTADAVSYVARTDITGFTVPIGTTSLKVRVTVMGRNPASTGWKLGIDLLSLSQGHAMGPLFASGKEGAGRLAFNGSVIAHILERGPWVNAKHFLFANNVGYNRRNRFVMIGNTASWTDPIHAAFIGNTFIDGQNMGTSARPAIARQTPPTGTELYETGNVYDPGDRINPAPTFDPLLEPLRVTTNPTEQVNGVQGFVPLSAAAGYRAALLSAGARPNDRDIMEARVMNEVAAGATVTPLAQRPGKTKNSVAEAGGWPVYAQNAATWTLPANPNADDDSDGYTNIEEWLQQLSAQLEGTPAAGNNYQAEFTFVGGGGIIVTNAAGANGTGYVTAPASATAATITFNRVDGGTGGARLLRIRYALAGAAQSGQVIVNGTAQSITFTPTGGSTAWMLLDVPVTLASGTTNIVVLKAAGAGLPNIDDFTVTGTDVVAPAVTVPANITVDATSPNGATVTFAVSAVDTVDGTITPVVTPASGSLFAPGTTTVSVSATDVAGNATTRSFTVTVLTHAAAIVTSPASQTVTAGSTVTLSVVASGTPELIYDWRRGGVSLGAPSAPTLTLPAILTSASGDYSVVVTNAFGSATSAPATLTVNKTPVVVTLGSLNFTYSGTPKPVTVSTVPDRLVVDVTYNGSSTPPTLPGFYTVVATVNEANFAGTATGTLSILTDVLVRHAPTLNGAINGSIQVLLAENITLNGNASVGQQLLVPGTPTVQLNGAPSFGGTTDSAGSANPTSYQITLNGGSHLGGLLRRVDPIAMPVVNAPAAPTGTRNVTLNSSSQSAGDFTTVRNLTLNGNAGVVAVPAGTYGNFTANGGNGFRLGVVGATTPSAYNVQSLTLNGNGLIEVVGPVVLTLASGTSLNASIGNAAHPEWLELRIAAGGLTLSGDVACYGSVIAPNGTVTVNGRTQLAGQVTADRFTLNGSAAVSSSADQTAPTVTISSPTDGATVTGTVTVTAAASDNIGVAAVQFKLDGVNLGIEDTAAPFTSEWATISSTPGSHVLTAIARDMEGNTTTAAAVHVTVADQISPTVAIATPANGATATGVMTLTATASDNVAVVGVKFQLDGSDLGAEITASPFSFSWNSATATPGVHSLTAIARDAAGHVTTSAAVSLTVTDQSAPSIVITAPTDGTKATGIVAVTATASDNVAVVGVQFKLDGANLGAELTTAPYAVNWNTVPVTEGSHTLTAVARDTVGNTTTSTPVAITVANAIFETFESGSVAQWTPDGGTWTVTSEPGTHVYRQSDMTTVAYRAIRPDTNWADQAVEADVKLNASSGTNRFFGVFARRIALNDYYYLILRTNNTIELKKIVNNVAANLTTVVAFTVTPNTTYRLRLEVIGTSLKGYVNGQLKISASDTTFTAGTAGLLTFFTDVSFDDVHIDPTPLSPVLAADNFEAGNAAGWTAEAGAWSVATASGTQVYRQADAAATARAVIGQPTWTNQLIELDVRPQSFGSPGGWAGLLFRYVDAGHHYAVVLREGNTIELRRIDDGVVTTLATATTPVTAGTLSVLRLNAVGNSLKVYRDGALVLQALDGTYPAGKVALATAGAAADFDDVVVVAP